ncbi:MAG TPA: glycoside hydrolase [Clostridia bacterium]|nr:glycoside hydrolase [Clostridia bacterium]
MKLTLLGGGGVRSPFLAKYIASRAASLDIDHVVFMDNDPDRLRIFGGLSKKVAETVNSKLRFEITTSAVTALEAADFIITSLRVGGEKSRAADERRALEEGVLGQETTGAGGFAMALRSIPVLNEYCRLVKKHSSPDAVILNFTNPSGLVTQALRSEGFDNVYGICDGPGGFFKEVAKLLEAKPSELSVECFGLNHLSWFRNIRLDGKEITGELISDPRLYTETEAKVFDPELLAHLGMIPNAYLYYYYHREQAVCNILKSAKTRGEIIKDINEKMLQALWNMDIEQDFEKMLGIYLTHYSMRESSYMSIESGKKINGDSEEGAMDIFKAEFGEGYAGVALDLVEALVTRRKKEVILSVPNMGVIEGLADDDVVEITCIADAKGAKPVSIGKVPELQMSLIRQIKLYERLTVEAIKNKSISTAVDALMIHPLVGSYSIAKRLVQGYIEDYKEYTGTWR